MKQSMRTRQESYFRDLARLQFPRGYPTQGSVDILQAELRFQRAVQVYLWALPAMSLYSIRKELEVRFGAGSNVLVIWKDRIDAKTIMIAPNPDVIYGFAWLDLKAEGPTVVEVPPLIQGLFDDAWQRPLTDIGFAGPDRGTGGKYVIVPPHYKDEVPLSYHTVKSPTYRVFVLFRAFLERGETAQGVTLLEKSRIYPLTHRRSPPAMKFPNASGVSIDTRFPRDSAFFDNLAAFFNEETATPEEQYMRGMAATIGIVKGQPFEPDGPTR